MIPTIPSRRRTRRSARRAHRDASAASAAAASAATAAASAGSSTSGVTVNASANACPQRANSPGSRHAAWPISSSSAAVRSAAEVSGRQVRQHGEIAAADSTPTRPAASAPCTPSQRGNTPANAVSRPASRAESWNRRRSHRAVLAWFSWARTPRDSAWPTSAAVTASTLDRTANTAPRPATTSASESDHTRSAAEVPVSGPVSGPGQRHPDPGQRRQHRMLGSTAGRNPSRRALRRVHPRCHNQKLSAATDKTGAENPAGQNNFKSYGSRFLLPHDEELSLPKKSIAANTRRGGVKARGSGAAGQADRDRIPQS